MIFLKWGKYARTPRWITAIGGKSWRQVSVGVTIFRRFKTSLYQVRLQGWSPVHPQNKEKGINDADAAATAQIKLMKWEGMLKAGELSTPVL